MGLFSVMKALNPSMVGMVVSISGVAACEDQPRFEGDEMRLEKQMNQLRICSSLMYPKHCPLFESLGNISTGSASQTN